MTKRSSTTKSSSSSSISRRSSCACGVEVVLMKSNTAANPGRMFWRCRNWDKEVSCKFFRWADGSVSEQLVSIEEWQVMVHEHEEQKRKIHKLQKKLSSEKWKVKVAVCSVFCCIGLTSMVCMLAMVKCVGGRKGM
ncbi:Zinc finger, GRF-type [Sesbania bispinosa]|nr:Zinc finger, GRF-type [Sesbania bispinosa]